MNRDNEHVMTVAHCDRLHTALQNTLAENFNGLHDRISELTDKVSETNGRLRTVERDLASTTTKNDERWRHHDEAPSKHEHSVNVTRRDVQIVLVTLGAVGSLIAWLRWLWPLLHRALTTSSP